MLALSRRNTANVMFCHPGVCDCRCMSCTNAVCCHFKGGKVDKAVLKTPTDKQRETQLLKLRASLDEFEERIAKLRMQPPEAQAELKKEIEAFLADWAQQACMD